MAKDKEEVLAEIRGSFAQGIEHYNSGNFAAAETGFVKVLKPLLSKPIMKEIHPENIPAVQEELLGAMYHLGEIYLQGVEILKAKYGECTDHHSKAAAIFQYCAGFAAKYEATIEVEGQVVDSDYFLRKAYDVEKAFLVQVPGIETAMETGDADESKEASYYEDYKQRVENYRSDLANIRAATKEMLNDISDLGVEQIADRAAAVEDIYRASSQFFVDHQPEPMSLSADSATTTAEGRTGNGLIQRLLSECHDQLGNPPQGCDYSIVGLGSLSLGTMTPWSDLEFAVLINEDRENYREYFRNLTQLLHIKIINLGETMLRSVGIESLNNFRTANEADDWFWDDVIESGFSFDGAAWHACKHPLGRQGGYKVEKKVKNEQGAEVTITESKPDYELILTPQQLVGWQFAPEMQETSGERAEEPIDELHPTFATDRHLVQSLRSMTLIDGRQVLLDEYRDHFRTESLSEENQQILREHDLVILREDVDKFRLKLGNEEEGKLIDVKKDIYRLGERVVSALSDYYGITAEQNQSAINAWQRVDCMQTIGNLRPEGAQHLKEALGIAAELRLSTYANNESQGEMMSSYVPAVEHLDAEARHRLLQKTFHIEDTGILHHFYYVMIRLQDLVQGFCNQVWHDIAEMVLAEDDLYGDSNYNKGMVHARFLEYTQAMEYLEAVKEERPGDLRVLQDLYFLYSRIRDVSMVLNVAQRTERLISTQNFESIDPENFFVALNNLGKAYYYAGQYTKAVDFYQQGIQSLRKVSSVSDDFAACYSNLGVVYISLGQYDEAILKLQAVLKILGDRYSSVLASAYNNIIIACNQKGDFNAASVYGEEAIKIFTMVYRSTPNHPDIGTLYNNLGNTYRQIGKYDTATECYQKALQIYAISYSSMLAHIDITRVNNGLGNVCCELELYNEAIAHYQKALEIQLLVYKDYPQHSDIANSYNNLGNVYCKMEEYDKAEECYKIALEMRKKVYESTPDHLDVATSYDSLGTVYADQAQYDKAEECYKIALSMRERICKSMLNHPDVAMSYNNLGVLYVDKKEYNAAIECYTRALDIYKVIYSSNPQHLYIIKGYNNLAIAYLKKGEFDVAIEHYQWVLDAQSTVIASGSCNFDVSETFHGLGIAYFAKSRYDVAIKCYQKALEAKRGALSSSKSTSLGMANLYNDLGNALHAAGDNDAAIEEYNKTLDIFEIAYASTPNHPDIVDVCNNLGNAYFCKGEYQEALLYVKTGYVYNAVLIQLGNKALLEGNQDKARGFYRQIDQELEQIDFRSEQFIQLQLGFAFEAYQGNALPAAINCQLALIKLDPGLIFANHHHNLACFYSTQGNTEKANSAFLQALEYSEATNAALHVEYAQFLILNRDNPLLSDVVQTISEHLYAAIVSENIGGLFYGRLEQNTVCEVLSNLIRQTNADVVVEPKVLAYYLLITHPEYIIEGPEAVGRLLETFRELAIELSDEISATLFADAKALVASTQVVEVAEDQEGISTADHEQPPTEPITQATLSGQAENVGEYPTS